MLNFKEAITTRGGSKIKIYHVYDGYIHGAYQSNDHWHPAQWTIQGFYLHPSSPTWDKTSLDLINNEYYEPQTA